MLRLGSGYSQFGSSGGESLCLQSTHSFSFNVNAITPFSGGQFFVPEIVNIFKLQFLEERYPTDRFNPFCPYCLGLVDARQMFRVCHQGLFLKAFLAHEECLRKQQSSCINTMVQQINHANLSFVEGLTGIGKKIGVGEKQWFVEVQLSHSLSNRKYFTLKRVVRAGEGELVWDFGEPDGENGYFPNIIAFPYPDFDLSLSLTKLAERGSRAKHRSYVDVQKLRYVQDRIVKISTQDYDLFVKVICSIQAKKALIEQMNFKYRFPYDNGFPLVQLLRLKVKLESDYSDEDMYICDDTNSNISNLLKEDDSLYSTFRSTDFNNCQDDRSSLRSQTRSQQSMDRIDYSYLVQSKELGQFVRHKVNSRKFQEYLSEARPEELEMILESLAGEFSDLVVDQYANYMMQKLFKICSKAQQYFILKKILPKLSEIVMNKQGTHTLQDFVSLLTLQTEFQPIVQRVMANINELSFHSNSTHFVQKVIKHCPFQQLAPVFRKVAHNFVEYAVNKNALCVIKRLMNKVKEVQYKNMVADQSLIKEVKKGFMTALFLNFNRLIQDAFGNYVVQFCYQTFGDRYCQGIANKIIQKFAQYSLQKYSSSVVYRCVTTYWNSKQTCQLLNSILSANQILSMYRNKDGNKILLALMEKYEGTLVHEKIYSQIVKAEPSKIAQDRWGMVLGCRSGTVGTYYSSFSEAVKPTLAKKKKKNNIIQ